MEKYKIEIKKSTVKELYSIPHKDIKKILARIKSLSSDLRPEGSMKLTDREDYQIRVGNYRIIYSINDDFLIIVIIKIGHRKEIYR